MESTFEFSKFNIKGFFFHFFYLIIILPFQDAPTNYVYQFYEYTFLEFHPTQSRQLFRYIMRLKVDSMVYSKPYSISQ